MKAGELLAAQRNLQVTDELLGVNRSALEVVGTRVRQGASPSLDEGLQLVEVNRLDASRQLAPTILPGWYWTPRERADSGTGGRAYHLSKSWRRSRNMRSRILIGLKFPAHNE